ncbi:Nn.00g024310.m01.CDS01 [Neocucurbitaria sp. VM-36]
MAAIRARDRPLTRTATLLADNTCTDARPKRKLASATSATRASRKKIRRPSKSTSRKSQRALLPEDEDKVSDDVYIVKQLKTERT